MGTDIEFTEMCQNCGKLSEFEPFASRSDLYRCKTCGSWTWRVDQDLNLDQLYNADYFEGAEYIHYPSSQKSQKLNFRRKIDLLKEHVKIDSGNWRILEIGSATGIFLDELRNAGIENSMGIELSSYARDCAVEKGHRVLPPFDENLSESLSAFQPNIICAWDVWEHLETPCDVITGYINSCEADSDRYFAISTVDASSKVANSRKTAWRQFHPPTHIHYPTRKAFREFADHLGGAICYQDSFGMYRPLGEYIGAVFSKNALAYLMPKLSFLSFPIKVDLSDIQLVIGKIGP